MMVLARGAAGAQAVVDAGGVAAVVAAMRQHTADLRLQRFACCAPPPACVYLCGTTHKRAGSLRRGARPFPKRIARALVFPSDTHIDTRTCS